MANESDVQLFSGGTGALLRTINVQTIINGQLTTVQMEVAAISDTDGNVISVSDLRDFAWKRRVVQELTAIRLALSDQCGQNYIELAKSRDESI